MPEFRRSHRIASNSTSEHPISTVRRRSHRPTGRCPSGKQKPAVATLTLSAKGCFELRAKAFLKITITQNDEALARHLRHLVLRRFGNRSSTVSIASSSIRLRAGRLAARQDSNLRPRA